MFRKVLKRHNLCANVEHKLTEAQLGCAGESAEISAVIRNCKQCARPFPHRDLRIKHCSSECAIQSRRLHRSARQRKHRTQQPQKELCRQTLKNAVLAGKVRRPDRCDACGIRSRVQAHHEDYSRPFFVEWVCRPCHLTKDAQRRQRELVGA